MRIGHVRVHSKVKEISVRAELHLRLASVISIQNAREYHQVTDTKDARGSDSAGQEMWSIVGSVLGKDVCFCQGLSCHKYTNLAQQEDYSVTDYSP